MIKIKILVALMIAYPLLFGCTTKNSTDDSLEKAIPLENGYSMIFFSLDNYALIYVDDQLVHDTRKSADLSKSEWLIDLNPFVNSQSILTVEGYNTSCNSCEVNNYEFVYEIYRNGESIDYINEYSNQKQSKEGLSLTKKHVLSEL